MALATLSLFFQIPVNNLLNTAQAEILKRKTVFSSRLCAVLLEAAGMAAWVRGRLPLKWSKLLLRNLSFFSFNLGCRRPVNPNKHVYTLDGPKPAETLNRQGLCLKPQACGIGPHEY